VSRERIFWIAIAGALLGLTAAYLFLVRPAQAEVRAALAGYDRAETQLNELRGLRRKKALRQQVPTSQNLLDMTAYKDWLGGEARAVEQYFRRKCEATLDAPLTAEKNPSPSKFKFAYLQRLESLKAWLGQRWPRGTLGEGVFVKYPWADSPSLPEPKQFGAIQRDLWLRSYLLRSFVDHGAAAVSRLAVSPAAKGAPADRIRVSMDFAMAPEQLLPFLEDLFELRPQIEADLIVLPHSMTVAKTSSDEAATPARVKVWLVIDVLDFPPPHAEAPK